MRVPRHTFTECTICRGLFFLSIMNKLNETSLYFTERHDTIDHIGLTPLQKCTAVLRQLAYDMTIDTIDKYLKLGKTTDIKCLKYYRTGHH
jgi:hypothetical protein